jgi:hypothetical protein
MMESSSTRGWSERQADSGARRRHRPIAMPPG